jgi:hypothetical protein
MEFVDMFVIPRGSLVITIKQKVKSRVYLACGLLFYIVGNGYLNQSHIYLFKIY